MQEEKFHKGSTQVNGVFEFVCHKQSFDKEVFHIQLFAKKVQCFGRTEQNLKLKILSIKAT